MHSKIFKQFHVPYATRDENKLPFFDTCTIKSIQKYCDDEPANTSCHENITYIAYRCFKGTQKVTKVKKECIINGLIINDAIKLNTKDYACSHDLEGENIIVLCDSRFDGNGDGKCSSGESCQKFVINGDKVMQLEKNSREDFIESDESFFLEKAFAEVLR